MSLVSKFKQFVTWVSQHKRKDDEFLTDNFQDPAGGTWEVGETQAKAQEFKDASKWWVTLGLFTAGYWDAKLGGSQQQPNSGPITRNNDVDALILTGGLIAAVVAIFYIVKKFL